MPASISGRSRRCSACALGEASCELRVVLGSARPSLDASGRLEPRDRGDERRAGDVELRRERVPVLVERRLLGHRRPRRTGSARRRAGTRAAGGRSAALRLLHRTRVEARRSTDASVVFWRRQAAMPTHDEEPLAGLHEPEPASLAEQLLAGVGRLRCATAAAVFSVWSALHLGRVATAARLRAHVGVQRLPVEERRRATIPPSASRRVGRSRGTPIASLRALRSLVGAGGGRSGDVDLDHVRRAGQVDRRAGGQDDTVAGVDDART